MTSAPIRSSRPHGDSTITLACPRDEKGHAWTIAEVDHIDVLAFEEGATQPFWEHLDIDPADLMFDTPQVDASWPHEGGYTLRHELPYDVGTDNPFVPPFGEVRLEIVLHLANGRGRQTITHLATQELTRSTSGGHV